MEQPVVRSRGRPRKRRKEDENEGKSVPEPKKQAIAAKPIALVGRYVLKKFPRNGVFLGKVVYYDCGLYRVNYEDGDFEDLDSSEIRLLLIRDGDFNDDLAKRKVKLEKLVLHNSAKAAKVSEKDSAEAGKVEPAIGVPVPSELNGGNDVDDEADGDSSSDSGTGVRERDSVSDVDALPLPPPLQLPQSSGTIGVPEPCVSHLFAVYGFLRSFSTRLFLQPFTLDEFVGSLNCPVSNTLFDAIHVSLMRVLRRHLESLPSESSELAKQCLRCCDWSLLDMLTWPVFVIQYLVVNGYTKGPEWKRFYDEVFNVEYYLLSVSRKLMILQILCDDVLECEELKAEMNMRKESEVGIDYDAEDIVPAETGPRKVYPRYGKTSFSKDKEAMKFVSASDAVNQPGNSTSYCGDTEGNGGDFDRNGDECCLCGMDGILLCCDGCPSAYHSRCIGVMKMFIPDGPWYCPECKINMTGPTIAKGTSLRGAAIFGKDLYGQLFMGTCNHLLVLNTDNNEYCLRYYNPNDIPKVIEVLCKSMQHRPIYSDICMAVLQYWNIPENFLLHSASTETIISSANVKDDRKFSTPLLPPPIEDNHKPVSLVSGEYSPTTVSLVDNNNVMPSLIATSVIAQSPAPESSGIPSSKVCLNVNMKLPDETKVETIISAGSGRYQSDMNYQNSINMSTAIDRSMCSLVNIQFSNHGHADNTGLPLNFSLQTKETTQTDGFGYMGLMYKPMSYINSYMHGDFAASAAAKFAILSSEESKSEGRVSDSQRKTASAYTYLQAKAFSLTASRFFWPSSEKKLVEVPRERCGWCFSCKAPVSSKRGCMLNHAALNATKGAMKILAGFSSIRSGEGILPSIATYIIYMEECLRGLIVGPFQNASYRKLWRKQVEQATTFSAIKPLLLELEENIRIIAFCGDWVKLMDDWLVEFPTVQSAASTLVTTQKRAQSGRHYKKRSSNDEATADGSHESSVWWRGGKFTKLIFQKAALPKSMVRKAARQGGSRKISGIFYADGSEIPKRSRQLVWRVAVQMSRNASQLALQVRCLDFFLRWSDLIRPEQNIADGKGQETEASVFRNANICDNKSVEGKTCYGIAFGSQKHLPSRVMKNVVEIEKDPKGKEKYWFSETRIPLYLVKEYEEANEKVLFDKEPHNGTSQLCRRRLKDTCKNVFFYLTCKRDSLVFFCSVCQMAVSIRTAHKCNACQGYCHEACSISPLSTNGSVEYFITCKKCYHAKLLAPKETSDESPNSPLLLQGQENSSGTAFKGPRIKGPDVKQVTPVTVMKGPKAKSHGQTMSSTRTKNGRTDKNQAASDSISTAKSRRKNCSWGIIWNKKSNEDTNIEFRIKNILLKGGSSDMPNLEPVCHLCRKEYRSDLMYICCETCQNWYHAEAVELDESKIPSVLGFKCCKCRRIKSPLCPYSDSKPKTPYVKKSRSKASKKEHSGVDSDSGTFSDMRECEPATPIFPVDNDPLLFSLSNVELITEHQAETDVERNTVSVPGPKKLPVRRHVKHEGDGDGSFGGIHLHSEFTSHSEAGNLSKSADSILPLEYDPALNLDSNLLNNSESLNNECMEFEPHTYFSLTELLLPDDSGQFEGVNMSGDWSDYPEYFGTGVAEECGGVSSVVTSEPEYSLQDGIYSCCKCSQIEPSPDLCCEICGNFFHSHCSSWPELPSTLGWRCENCRQWQ